jgi:hypothetical protein
MGINELDIQRIRTVLDYNEKTGEFTWKLLSCDEKKGNITTFSSESKYMFIRIGENLYNCARLAWMYYYGVEPNGDIDHIDGNRSNNSISNLRDIPHSINSLIRQIKSNNTSGSIGVRWRKDRNKWQARIKVNGIEKHLGHFDDKNDAVKIYEEYKKNILNEYIK